MSCLDDLNDFYGFNDLKNLNDPLPMTYYPQPITNFRHFRHFSSL